MQYDCSSDKCVTESSLLTEANGWAVKNVIT